MTGLTESIAANVRELMDERGLTQQQLGLALGYSQQAISDRLTARTRFSIDDLAELADMFAVPERLLMQPRRVVAR